MASKYLLIKTMLKKEKLSLMSAKKYCYIEDDIKFIKDLNQLYNLYIRDLSSANIKATNNMLNKILYYLSLYSEDTYLRFINDAIDIIKIKLQDIKQNKSNRNISPYLEKKIKELEVIKESKKVKIKKETKPTNYELKDYTDQYTITVDQNDTKIHDDAFFLKRDFNNDYLLYIHICDYEYDNHSKKEKSLDLQKVRKVLTYYFRFSSSGLLKDYNVTNGYIKIKAAINYNDVSHILTIKNNHEQLYNMINNMECLAGLLRERREERIILKKCEFVREFSIFLNTFIAQYFNARKWLMIYYNIGENNTSHYSNEVINTPYATITSPLRRSVDKINEQLIKSYLLQEYFPDEKYEYYQNYLNKLTSYKKL